LRPLSILFFQSICFAIAFFYVLIVEGNPPPYDGNYGQQLPLPPPPPPKKSMVLPIVIIAIVAIVVIAVVLFFVFSNSGSNAASLYGTWDIDTMEIGTSITGAAVTTDVDGTITFNSDGTYTSDGAPAYFSDSGTYTMSGNTITINSLEWDYSVSGNSLTLEYEISMMGFGTTTTFHCSSA